MHCTLHSTFDGTVFNAEIPWEPSYKKKSGIGYIKIFRRICLDNEGAGIGFKKF